MDELCPDCIFLSIRLEHLSVPLVEGMVEQSALTRTSCITFGGGVASVAARETQTVVMKPCLEVYRTVSGSRIEEKHPAVSSANC